MVENLGRAGNLRGFLTHIDTHVCVGVCVCTESKMFCAIPIENSPSPVRLENFAQDLPHLLNSVSGEFFAPSLWGFAWFSLIKVSQLVMKNTHF